MVSSNITAEPTIQERAPKQDEITLGYAYGIDEETDAPVWKMKGMPESFRARHFYVIGGSGVGKTKFLQYLIRQDIGWGNGFGVIDPHGDLIEDIKGWLLFAKYEKGVNLANDVVLIEPTNPNSTIGFNPLERIKTGNKEVETMKQVGDLLNVFEKIWSEFWGPRTEDIMRHALIALVESNLTLAELPLLLSNPVVRQKIVSKVKSDECRRRFETFETLPKHTWREWVEPTLNKVNAFLSDKRIRQILCQPKSTFDLREILDKQKILLVKLEKGELKSSADLLGSLLLSKIQTTAFARTDTPEEQRVPFYLYIDEFQNFATKSFIETLSEARKYKLSLVLAHQNLAQLPRELQSSILANCGLQACFQVSREDAQILAKEMLVPLYVSPPGWEINVQNLQELKERFYYIKNKQEGGVMMVETPPLPFPHKLAAKSNLGITEQDFHRLVNEAKVGSRYGKKRRGVEMAYKRRFKKLTTPPKPKQFREKVKGKAKSSR